MENLTKVANATWMLKKWMNENEVPKRIKFKKALLELETFLNDNDVEIVDLRGKEYDSGLNCHVMNETFEEEADSHIIAEMVQPIVYQAGKLIQYGKVLLEDK